MGIFIIESHIGRHQRILHTYLIELYIYTGTHVPQIFSEFCVYISIPDWRVVAGTTIGPPPPHLILDQAVQPGLEHLQG